MTGPQRHFARGFNWCAKGAFDKPPHDARDLCGITCVRLGNIDPQTTISRSAGHQHGIALQVEEVRAIAEALLGRVVLTFSGHKRDVANRSLKAHVKAPGVFVLAAFLPPPVANKEPTQNGRDGRMKHDAHRYTRRILIQATRGSSCYGLVVCSIIHYPGPSIMTFWVIKFIGNFNLSKTRSKK